MISCETPINKLDHLNVHYVAVSAKDVRKMGGKPNLRVWCTITHCNNNVKFQAGFVAAGGGAAYISVNAARLKKLKATVGDLVNVTLTKDNSKYGAVMPEELAVVFEQMPEAKTWFDKLSDGKKRFAITHVDAVKNPTLRADRAVCIAHNLISCSNAKMSYDDLVKKQ